MVYVALLRGINVGGNNKIDMKHLKRSIEQAGFKDVTTYINTGNIIFSDQEHSIQEIASTIEKTIASEFGFSIKVLVLSLDEMRTIMSALPHDWTNDTTMKSDVLFLWDEVNDKSVLQQLKLVQHIDHARYTPGAILWSCQREHVGKSGMSKIIGTKLYHQVTIRNVNTARKLYDLMQQCESQ